MDRSEKRGGGGSMKPFRIRNQPEDEEEEGNGDTFLALIQPDHRWAERGGLQDMGFLEAENFRAMLLPFKQEKCTFLNAPPSPSCCFCRCCTECQPNWWYRVSLHIVQ